MLGKIKSSLRKSAWLSRSLLWQLLAIWQTRITLLSTVYKNEKISAIKQYFISDWEYIKIIKEIKRYKTKDGYDFGGVRLPPCVITPDYYLNLLKPHIENLAYEKDAIVEFYRQQKNIYPTLIYCKDICMHGEPKYVGSHTVSHGFTYFCNEVVINKNDVVVDLGSAPGDFAALCLFKGASAIYAFEPEESAKSDLEKLSQIYDNKITIVRKYVEQKTEVAAQTISLDDFVAENNITAINFIKADIEGHEAGMLLGAEKVLKLFKPKLVICTYHLENNAAEIEKIILSANDSYKIYKENGVLYAY